MQHILHLPCGRRRAQAAASWRLWRLWRVWRARLASHRPRAASTSTCSISSVLDVRAGSGKSALAAELARATGNAGGLIRVHVDDQMDAKALLGAYVCTAVSGEFAWQPGPLTQVRVTCGQCQLLDTHFFLSPQVKTDFLTVTCLCWLEEGVKATQYQQVYNWGGTVKTRPFRFAESCEVPEVFYSTGHYTGRHGLTE